MCGLVSQKHFREWPSGALSRHYANPIRNSLANSQPIQSPRIRQKEEAIHGGHPLILYNLYAREPRAFSDISKETRPTRFPLSPHSSRTVSAVTVCLFIKTCLDGVALLYSPDEFISRARTLFLSPLLSLSYLVHCPV